MYQIPIRFNYHLHLTPNIKLSPTIGYHFGINSEFGSSSSSRFSLFNVPTQEIALTASHDANYSLTPIFSSIEAGLSLNYSFPSFDIFIKSNYLQGFNKLVELDIDYEIMNLPPDKAKIHTNGNYISHVIGVNIPIIPVNKVTKRTKKLKEGIIVPTSPK